MNRRHLTATAVALGTLALASAAGATEPPPSQYRPPAIGPVTQTVNTTTGQRSWVIGLTNRAPGSNFLRVDVSYADGHPTDHLSRDTNAPTRYPPEFRFPDRAGRERVVVAACWVNTSRHGRLAPVCGRRQTVFFP